MKNAAEKIWKLKSWVQSYNMTVQQTKESTLKYNKDIFFYYTSVFFGLECYIMSDQELHCNPEL